STGSPGASAEPPPHTGTVQMRAVPPGGLRSTARELRQGGGAQAPDHTVGLRRPDLPRPAAGGQAAPAPAPAPTPPVVPGQQQPAQFPQQQAQQQAPSQSPTAYQQPAAQSPPAQQQQPPPLQPSQQAQQQAPGQSPPAYQQPGAYAAQAPAPEAGQVGQPSWAQQVQDLAGAPGMGGPQGQQGGGPDPVAPWRPPSSDPFLQAASQQQARPAALGKRLGARIVDGILTSAVAVGVAYPFAGKAVDHVQQKTDAVLQAGKTEQVWLIDATTGGYLALVLGALVLFGLLYEVLPTQRFGRTLGKKMFGIKVLTMEQEETPGFGGALVRWLVHGVLSVLVIGVVNVLWCVFDRPWRQCWHDKVARTFVSKDSGELRL
ncbi:MAG: RDD family protein, partial [Streptomyces sp.]